jgi:hypothetical protein
MKSLLPLPVHISIQIMIHILIRIRIHSVQYASAAGWMGEPERSRDRDSAFEPDTIIEREGREPMGFEQWLFSHPLQKPHTRLSTLSLLKSVRFRERLRNGKNRIEWEWNGTSSPLQRRVSTATALLPAI